jgi:hypothetical protein
MYESKQPNCPYKKLQYPTYVNDIDPNAHIKVLKRPLKIVVKPWKLTSLICLVSFSK